MAAGKYLSIVAYPLQNYARLNFNRSIRNIAMKAFKTITDTIVLSLLLAVYGIASASAQTAEPAPEGNTEPEVAASDTGAENEWYFHVLADEKYRFRLSQNPDEQDHDLSLYFDFGAIDPSDHFGADLSLGLWWDINGNPDSSTSSFAESNDTSPPLWFEVYKLSLDYHSDEVLRLARVGRQVTLIGKDAAFDGATLEISPISPQLDFYFMGGRTVHFFEIDADIFEDWLAGAGMVLRPHRDVRLELDYRFNMEDTTLAVSGGKMQRGEEIRDNSLGIAAWYRYEDWFRLNVFMRTLNDDISEAGGATGFTWLAQELGLDATVKAQTTTLKEVGETEDPFFAIKGESLPYVNFSFDAWKGFTVPAGIYGLHAGYQGRQLTKHDETPFNRNSGRAYVLFSAADIAVEGPFITAVFERWAEGPAIDDDGLWSFGGSAGYDVERVRCEIGSNYQLYKYDYYLDVDERAHVRTVFADLKVKALEWLAVKARYEYELFDRDVHTITLGLSQIY